MKITSRRGDAAIVVFVALSSASLVCSASADPAPNAASAAKLQDTYGKLPILFEANRGQAGPAARFIARGNGYTVFLTQDETLITLSHPTSETDTVIGMRFAGARHDAMLSGERKADSTSNYFFGRDPAQHITDIPHYGSVRRTGIYPGIDAVFYGNQRQLEYDLIVAPGANPGAIRLVFEGADKVFVDKHGNLVIRSANGNLLHHKPVVYQDAGGKRRSIAGRYVLRGGAVGFKLAAYDVGKPLVIDPVLGYGSHQGGQSLSNAITVDAAGNAYVAGTITQSSVSFPTVNAYDGSIGHGDTDAFVQKFNPAGTSLIYSTYLGGPKSVDKAVGIAIDGSGNAYVTGTTSGIDFPTSATAYQKGITSGGSFIAKLGPAGNTLVYSTYLLTATATGIAVDAGGNAFVTGSAMSGFVTTAGALQAASRSAGGNAFVFKLNPAGSAAVYATFLGGSGADQANGIALDAAGNAYVAGKAISQDFPTVNAFWSTPAGGQDAFVAKLNSAGTALVYSTYLGGSQDDYATAIAVDANGSAYATGVTASFDFPVLNAFQSQKGGQNISGTIDNAFVAKLSPDGSALAYSSFLGGDACIGPGSTSCFFSRPADIGTSIAVDAQGHAYVGGQTKSITFPRVDSLRPAVASNGDAAFVAKVSTLGGALLYSTLIGGQEAIGNPQDFVKGLAADAAGNVYGTGNIANFPTTAGPFQSSGGSVVFKLASGTTSLSLATSLNPATDAQQIVLTAAMSGGVPGASVIFLDGAAEVGSAPLNGGVATLTLNLAAGIHGISAIYRASGMVLESPVVYQVVNSGAVCN